MKPHAYRPAPYWIGLLILLALGIAGIVGHAQGVVPGGYPGVYLTRHSNLIIANDVAFPFDATLAADPLYATWDGSTKVVIVKEGWYHVAADVTTLGGNYGGPSNVDWLAAIGVNGIDLGHTFVAERQFHSSGGTADLMSIGSDIYLVAGDTVQFYVENHTLGVSSLLVESNPSRPPSSGNDYRTQPGTGAISPHLSVRFVGLP